MMGITPQTFPEAAGWRRPPSRPRHEAVVEAYPWWDKIAQHQHPERANRHVQAPDTFVTARQERQSSPLCEIRPVSTHDAVQWRIVA